MKIESIYGDTATVNVSGTKIDVNISFIENPAVEEYVLVHAGFAIKKIDRDEAAKTVELLNKMAQKIGK